MARFERELILERQKEGIALAKKAGVYKGRKHSLSASQAADLRRRLKAGERKVGIRQTAAIRKKKLREMRSALSAEVQSPDALRSDLLRA